MCVIDYAIITHLEEAEKETKWILNHLNISGKANSSVGYIGVDHI